MLYSFGRADQLDRAAIERLITALTRVRGHRTRRRRRVRTGPGRSGCRGWSSSSPARWVGRGCWTGCGTGWGSTPCCAGLAAGTRRDPVVERVLFALVANRALAPSSKLAATSWVAHDVHLPGLTGSDYRCPTTPATGRWTG